jgi:hypothetical protein
MRNVLGAMEAQGFRPRIQDAWRSPEDQLAAFNRGTSHLKFGFHNVTGAGGQRESLACDVIDDDHPFAMSTHYFLALALAARAQGLETGITWDLPPALAAGVEAALAAHDLDAGVRVGFDPTHCEVMGITPKQAKAGARPTFNGAAPPPPPPPATPHTEMRDLSRTPSGAHEIHVVAGGETLTSIARKHGTTVARLLELNPDLVPHPNLIHVGDRIRVS